MAYVRLRTERDTGTGIENCMRLKKRSEDDCISAADKVVPEGAVSKVAYFFGSRFP